MYSAYKVLSDVSFSYSFLQESYYQGQKSLAHIYRIVFPTILRLAADDDRVIKDLVKMFNCFLCLVSILL